MKALLFFSLLFAVGSVSGQVGINTETPTNTLDVNGDLRVRTTADVATLTTERVLVSDDTGVVKSLDPSILQSTAGSVAANTIAKASISDGVSLLNLGISGGWEKINFNTTDLKINRNNNFDVNTDFYTVPSTGIYVINFAFLYGTGVQASLLGGTPRVAILRLSTDTDFDVLAEKSFSGVNLAVLANITISDVTLNSVYQLNAGDRVAFGFNRAGVTLGLLGSSSTSFSIYKISD